MSVLPEVDEISSGLDENGELGTTSDDDEDDIPPCPCACKNL
jgi:hypothetical protein